MIKQTFILFLIYLLNSSVSLIDRVYHFIPTPQKIISEKGSFTFKDGICIQEFRFEAEILKDFIQSETAVSPQFVKEIQSASIAFQLIDSVQVPDNHRDSFLSNAYFLPGKEGYVLTVKPDKILIQAFTETGIFYGIQTLKQLISSNRSGNSIPCLSIYDYPSIPVRGWQDDISRGPIPTMEMLKNQIETMASYKQNYFTLYTEHVFKLEKYPEIAPADGISAEQLKELTEFAKKHHVELIGNYQAFGHMEKTLGIPRFAHLAENKHIISPALEESYQFLGDVFSEIAPKYEGEYFNINCDETFGLGNGPSKQMLDSMGIAGVYAYHINRIDDLLKPYGKKIIMWGDIAANHQEIVARLPKDMTVIIWAYHAAERFTNNITPISKGGLNFWIAPGVSCWSNVYPDFNTCKTNIYNFIRDGLLLGTTGVLNTSWDDDGSNFFNNNWHGLAWGAELSWNAPDAKYSSQSSDAEMDNRYNKFNQAFDAIFFGLNSKSMTELLVSFSGLHQSAVRNIQKNSAFFEPVFPIYNEFGLGSVLRENISVQSQLLGFEQEVKIIKPLVRRNHQIVEYLEFAIKQLKFTIAKNLLKNELYRFIHTKEKFSEAELKTKIKSLYDNLGELKNEYIKLWKLENREWWLTQNLERFERLENELLDIDKQCIIQVGEQISEKGRAFEIHSLFDNQPVYYTLDGTEPDLSSKKYTEPFFVKSDVIVSARVILTQNIFPVSKDSFVYHKAIGKLYKLNSEYSQYHPAYDGGGKFGLLDGRTGSASDIRNTRWQGYSGQNIDVEIDFGKTEELHSFSMGFYQNSFSWVLLPKEIQIYQSADGRKYNLVNSIGHQISQQQEGSLKHVFSCNFNRLKIRYLKVVGIYSGKLPEWHHAAGNASMLFADEIIIR